MHETQECVHFRRHRFSLVHPEKGSFPQIQLPVLQVRSIETFLFPVKRGLGFCVCGICIHDMVRALELYNFGTLHAFLKMNWFEV